ncbi:DUF6477 family protein [Palleronia rufa]|uniref:DUF6477 family protein n=1 Tax=Palleronia rufa TaxID=1530186 RepID=UPI00055C0757|nr:DUF6477 family protein [Palleronia rufa]
MTLEDTPLARLVRPRLLVSAARFGLSAYDRAAALSRLFGGSAPTPGTAALDRLADLERGYDAARRSGCATYSIAAHVEALTALMAEARLLIETRRVS